MHSIALTPPSSKVMKSGRSGADAVSQSVARVGGVGAVVRIASR
jgi:hypothetical protein